MNSLTTVLALLLAVAAPRAGASEPPVTGLWHGTIQAGATSLTMELDVTRDAQGVLHGSMESIDQAPGQLIPVSKIEAKEDGLHLELQALQARYTARLENRPDGPRWVGAWQQGSEVPLTLKQGPAPNAAIVTGLDGTWRAVLERGGQKLRLVLTVKTGPRGTQARLDSPDAGLMGMAVTELSNRNNTLAFKVPIAQVRFVGRMGATAGEVKGTWTRDGMPPARLVFNRDSNLTGGDARRKQAPRAPFPYTEENVSIQASGSVLSGTLARPLNARSAPAVLLIGGSGPQDRNHAAHGHEPFAVLSDHLVRRGYAVLRVDDRGVGQSTGTFSAATTQDFTDDAIAALAVLSRQPGVDARRLGIIGHSEGAVVAALAAQQSTIPSFIVLLGAPGVAMPQLFADQYRATNLAGASKTARVERQVELVRVLHEEARLATSDADARARLGRILDSRNTQLLGVPPSAREGLIARLATPWMRGLLRFEPSTTFKQLSLPVLILAGSLDRQVAPQANLAGLSAAFSSNAKARLEELPGLNHLFQTARTGHPAEYEALDDSFAVVAMDRIGAWLDTTLTQPGS